jgi:hypothetical protein
MSISSVTRLTAAALALSAAPLSIATRRTPVIFNANQYALELREKGSCTTLFRREPRLLKQYRALFLFGISRTVSR